MHLTSFTVPVGRFTGMLLFTLVCGAAELHVDGVDGADAAAGDAAHPWRTIAKATSLANPGDTVVIHAGTYALTSQLAFAHSGTTGNPITYTAAEGDAVLIDGGAFSCMSLQFRSHLIFRDLAFTTASNVVGASMVYMEGTNHCEFIDCTFSDMPAAIGSENTAVIRCMSNDSGKSTGCVFRNNLFRDNLSPALRLYQTDGWLIEHNEFRDCLQAVGGKDEPFNMTVRRNLVVGGGLAFYFAAQYGCHNVLIAENIVIGARQGFMIGGLGTGGNPREDLRLINNTFYQCRNFIVGWDDPDTTGQVYANNIFVDTAAANIHGGEDVAGRFLNLNKYGSVAVSASRYLMDWNCLRVPAADTSIRFIDANVRAQTIAEWTTEHPPFEAHSLAADPLFVDAAAGDFHLQPGSPCRAAGRSGEDMGAYPRGDDGTRIGRIPAEVIDGGTLVPASRTASVTEGTGTAPTSLEIRVDRLGSTTGAVGLPWTVVAGTATAMDDYLDTSGTLTWADGDAAAKTILIRVVADGAVEGSETCGVQFGSATGGATAPAPNSVAITIGDDDGGPDTTGSSGDTDAGSDGCGAGSIAIWLCLAMAGLGSAGFRRREPRQR